MASQADTRILHSFRVYLNVACLVTVGLSLMVMMGWVFGIPAFRSALFNLPAMRFNTALSLLWLGSSLWLLKDEGASARKKRLGQALAGLVLVLSLLTVSEYIFDVNLGIDEFFVKDLDSPVDLFPGRMSPIAILYAEMSSLCLLWLGSRTSRYVAIATASLALLAILNYLFDFQVLSNNSQFTLMPAHTGMAFLIFILATLAARPTPGIIQILASNLSGSRAIRSLFPVIIILTISIGLLVELGERIGLFYDGKESLLMVILLILVYAPSIYFIAKDVNRAEARLLLSDQILQRVNALVLVADMHGSISYVSPSVKTILGFEPSELLGDGWWKISRSSAEDGTAEKERVLSAAGQGEMISPVPYEREIQDRWGNTHWIMWVDALGPDSSIIGVGHDVTDRIRSEHALRRSEKELRALSDALEQRVVERTADLNRVKVDLERASRAKDEFLANMSHELRTPLNSILGLSELLLEQIRGPLNEYQQKTLRIIESSGQHLLALINDVLDISKIEAGKLQLHPETVEVSRVCEVSLAFVREQAVKKSILLEFRPDAAGNTIAADPRYLKQILVNLLTNAVKFTPANGQVALEVITDAEQGLMQFRVRDTGIGITPENLSQLFRPFVQVESSLNRQYEGTGLGLALVQRLADLHGGSVQVESAVGKGSCFTVNLPWQPYITSPQTLAEEVAEFSASGQMGITDAVSSMPVPRGRILLVEDNPANVLTIGEYLEHKNFSVVVAHNGLEALAQAEASNPNIILMDIQMPIMDGLEATRRLRANPRFRSVPIVALTALAMPGDREHCLQAGANEYVSKPVSLKQLVKIIDYLTGHGE